MSLRGFQAALALASVLALCCSHPRQAEEIYQKASAAYQDERFEEGISLAPSDAVLVQLRASQELRDRFRVLRGELMAALPDYAGAIAILSAPLSENARPETDMRRRGALGLALCRSAENAQQRENGLALLDTALAETKARTYEEGYMQLRRGTCLQRMARYDEARKAYSGTRDAATAIGDHLLEARAHVSLGNLSALRERFDEAARHMADALGAASAAGPAGSHVARRARGSLGWHHYELGDYELALDTLRRFEAATDRERSVNESNLASTLAAMDQLPQASRHFEAALGAARRIRDPRLQASALQGLAVLSYRRGEWREAAHWNAESRSLIASLGQKDLEPANRLNEARILAAQGRRDRAGVLLRGILAAQGVRRNVLWSARNELGKLLEEQGQLQAAEAEFRKAMTLVEQARSDLEDSQDRISFLAGRMEIYRGAMQFMLRRNRPADALRVADRSRGKALAERSRAAAIPRKGSVFFYWLDEPVSYLWVVSGGAMISHHTLPAAREINDLVDRHNRFILRARDPLSEGGDEGRRLFEILVKPALSVWRDDSVLMVPDGGLHALNWETLIAPDPDRFWIQDVAVTVGPGLNRSGSPAGLDNGRILLIGDPAAPDPSFGRLLHAAEELRQISQLFARTTQLRDAQANPRAAKEALPGDFAYVHFAAHATTNQLRPLESAIVLSNDGTAHKLYAGDVAGLQVRSRLVTLSACQAAGAKAYRGEGLVGFAWAFLGAGAENVIASLWPVEDASTPQFMERMYRHIKAGHAPGVALRQAKIEFLRSGTALRKPFYWGSFLHFQH